MEIKQEQIPILTPAGAIWPHHFGMPIEWKPFLASFYNKFHINRIEDYIEHLNFPLSPHRKTVFDFIFLTHGSTCRSKGLDSYTISANTFFFLPAFQITTHKFMTPETRGYYCHFDPEILNNAFIQPKVLNEYSFLQFLGNPVVKIDSLIEEAIINILRRLENEYQTHQSVKSDILSAYLLALFAELGRYTEPEQKAKENSALRITQQYKNALTQYIYQKQTVSAYAEMLCLTPNHLNKCVKSVTGKSAHDFLDEMLLLEVKALLKQTTLSISEIAFKIGKDDPSDFSKFFKTKTGLTPSEYRIKD